MKLARISHYRCDSYESTSYVSIPEDMTVDTLDEFIQLAVGKALDAEIQAKAVGPAYPDQTTLLKTLPKETTIAQLEVEFEKRKKVYAEWEVKKKKSRKSFNDWLKEVSEGKIISLHEHDCGDFAVDCSWGHNHGLSPDYSEDGL